MENTYSSLRNAFLDFKKENSENYFFAASLLVLLTIPLPYALNSIALGIFFLASLFSLRKHKPAFNTEHILPICLYLLMAASLFWSIDQRATLKALPKEVSLAAVPLAFILFGRLAKEKLASLFKFYSYGILCFGIFYLVKAIARYLASSDTSVFFYHELVTKDVNAIHVSVYMALAFFFFFTKTGKRLPDYLAMAVLLLLVFLLSSKNIIVVFILLIIFYYSFYTKASKRMRIRNLLFFILFLVSLTFVGKIKERFLIEFYSNTADSTVNDVISKGDDKVYNVSISQAWNNKTFQQNDFFPGTAFRVYQFRIFTEIIKEEDAFLTGLGLNASYPKIKEKAFHYNIFTGNAETDNEGYQNKNFHNQYIQNFAELGVFGFIILIGMLFLTIRNALNKKDFIHLAFGILMISLFLTESFLWRQRGVIFFTMFYCLFNSNTALKAEIKTA